MVPAVDKRSITKKSGVVSFRRKHASIHTHKRKRPLVFVVQSTVENQLFRRRAIQPSIIGDLVFQLTRTPKPA